MDNKAIVDKIRKLLALSKSSNEHEAARALEQANRLLLLHNLEMKDVEGENDLSKIVEDDLEVGGRIMNWKKLILQAVLKLNNCDLISAYAKKDGKLGYKASDFNRCLKAIGKRHNIDISVSMYDYLKKTQERKIKINNPHDKNAFRIGFAHAIYDKIEEIIYNREKEKGTVNDCTALVVVEKALIDKYKKEKFEGLQMKSYGAKKVDAKSFYAGQAAGRQTSLNGQVNNNSYTGIRM